MKMNERQLVAAAAVLLAVLAVTGRSSMDAKDQAVIDRLEKLDIVTIPAGATKINTAQRKGGGSDLMSIRTSSTVQVVYASPLPAARVGDFYHETYDTSWDLKDNGAAGFRPGEWWGGGGSRSDPQTTVEIKARPPAGIDMTPVGTGSVVDVTVAATRE